MTLALLWKNGFGCTEMYTSKSVSADLMRNETKDVIRQCVRKCTGGERNL